MEGGTEDSGLVVCLRCGKLMPAASLFCNSCGADLRLMPEPGLQGAVEPKDFKGLRMESPPAVVPAAPGATIVQPAAKQAVIPGATPAPTAASTVSPSGAQWYQPLSAPQAYYGYPASYRPAKTDEMAIVSVVCAIISYIALPLLAAVFAIILGYVSRERIRKSDEELGGENLALAGIIAGIFNVVLCVIVLVVILVVALYR